VGTLDGASFHRWREEAPKYSPDNHIGWFVAGGHSFGESGNASEQLQRYIPMLLRRIFAALGFQHRQRLNQLLSRLVGLDDGVDEATVRATVSIYVVGSGPR
jgi:hypothetical protein